MTWKMIVEKLHCDDGNLNTPEQSGWLGWDGWVSVNNSEKNFPDYKNRKKARAVSE